MPAGMRVALVTGGGRGIGAEVVRGLASRGYTVAIHCHASLPAARALAAEIEAAGGQALAVTANLREEGAVRVVVHRVLDHFGRLDVVAACARLRRSSPLADMTSGDLLAHYEVNVIGTCIVAQEAVAAMLLQPEGGTIVGLATRDEPQPGDIAFAASQAAIPALMQSLTAECATRHPRVRAGFVTAAGHESTAATASFLLALVDDLAHRR